MRKNDLCIQLLFDQREIKSNGCWEWLGTKSKMGYGTVQCNHKKIRVHRAMAHLWFGFDLASSLLICHTCDNPSCFNPAHLFAGTLSCNALDAVKKNRWVNNKGERHGNAKLTDSEVLGIKVLLQDGVHTATDLAKAYGVCRATITSIKNNVNWSHIKVNLFKETTNANIE